MFSEISVFQILWLAEFCLPWVVLGMGLRLTSQQNTAFVEQDCPYPWTSSAIHKRLHSVQASQSNQVFYLPSLLPPCLFPPHLLQHLKPLNIQSLPVSLGFSFHSSLSLGSPESRDWGSGLYVTALLGITVSGSWNERPGGETEEEEPKQWCAAIKCKWLFDPEDCTPSSHVNSLPGLSIRGQKGCTWYPTTFSFLGLSIQSPSCCVGCQPFLTELVSRVLPESHYNMKLCPQS